MSDEGLLTNIDYLRGLHSAVSEFRVAFSDFMKLHVVNDSFMRGLLPAAVPKKSASKTEIDAATQRAAVAAGRAREAPPVTHMYVGVEGVGRIDPIAAWASVTRPKPVLEPQDVFDACDQMLGALDAMAAKARALAPPTLTPDTFHPLIWGAAGSLWNDGHRRQAVASAAEALISQVKVRTSRNDVAETDLWKQVLSSDPPAVGRPRLRWPGDDDDRTVKSMRDGLRMYAPGLQMTVRNMAIHTSGDMSQQEGLERLAALSLLARWLDDCELAEAEPQ